MLRLEPMRFDGDPAAFAPGFGGDSETPRQIVEQTRAFLEANPRDEPWGSYVAIVDGPVAFASFKHPPDDRGAVEIAYMTFPGFEGQGHARATVAVLVKLAAQSGAKTIVAHTLPEENASNRALRGNGFEFAGEVVDPEDGPVWRWSRVA